MYCVSGSTAPPADYVENIVFNNAPDDLIPNTPAKFGTCVQQYWADMSALLLVLMEISARALGQKRDMFDDFFPGMCIGLEHIYGVNLGSNKGWI